MANVPVVGSSDAVPLATPWPSTPTVYAAPGWVPAMWKVTSSPGPGSPPRVAVAPMLVMLHALADAQTARAITAVIRPTHQREIMLMPSPEALDILAS